MCNRFPAISAESVNRFFLYSTHAIWTGNGNCEEKSGVWKKNLSGGRGGGVTKMNQCWYILQYAFYFRTERIKALNWNESANESARRPAVVRMTNVECACVRSVYITCEIYCTIVLISTWLSSLLLLVVVVSLCDVILLFCAFRCSFFYPNAHTHAHEMNDKFRVNEVISSEKWHNEIIKI